MIAGKPPPLSYIGPQSSRSPTDIDRVIADRLRKARMVRGFSQVALAEALGITLQQLRKYEGGLNRLSVARLRQVAATLDAPVSWFFAVDEVSRPDVLITPSDARMLEAFRSLPSDLALAFLDLVTMIDRSQTGTSRADHDQDA